MQKSRVLGVSIGTQRIGLAIVEQYFVFDCWVQFFRGKWSKLKQRAILKNISEKVVDYNVTAIAVKLPPNYCLTNSLNSLLHGIDEIAKKHSIVVHVYTLTELKRKCEIIDSGTKNELKTFLIAKYNLLHLYNKSTKSKVDHYIKIFEAVGAAHVELETWQ